MSTPNPSHCPIAQQCKRRIDRLESMLCDIYDELEGYEDIKDGAGGQQLPNWAMSIRQRIDEVLP